jgi:hypothetical protein
MSVNEKLIKNLENQVGRVVRQLKDLEECRYVNRLINRLINRAGFGLGLHLCIHTFSLH